MSVFRCPSCKSPLTEAEWNGLEQCPSCQAAFRPATTPALSAVSPTPVTTPPGRPSSSAAILWGMLGVLAVALGCILLLAMRPTSQAPGISPEELARVEVRLKAIEERVQAAQAGQSSDWKDLQTRLDTLDTRLSDLGKTGAGPAADLKAQGQLLARLETRLEALSQRAFAPPAPPGPLQIRVISKEWGDAEPDNVQAVCVSAASELWAFFPNRRLEPITVTNSKKGPMTLFGRGPDGERRVLIDIDGRLWARCAYQFSHEFCHVLCNSREAKNPNLWFEEALCETASLFALRQMAQSWKVKPPYPNWKSYSTSLDDYVDITTRETPPLENLTLAEWFARNEAKLRADATDRPRNRVVALALLKLLERDPHHWQAVGYLNQWDVKEENLSFSAYLSDWQRRVPVIHRPFVKEVADLLKVELK